MRVAVPWSLSELAGTYLVVLLFDFQGFFDTVYDVLSK